MTDRAARLHRVANAFVSLSNLLEHRILELDNRRWILADAIEKTKLALESMQSSAIPFFGPSVRRITTLTEELHRLEREVAANRSELVMARSRAGRSRMIASQLDSAHRRTADERGALEAAMMMEMSRLPQALDV